MEYLPVSRKDLEKLEAILSADVARQKSIYDPEQKEWIKFLAETEALLKKVTLKKMKIKSEGEE